jgi:hypothetical protein
VSLHRFDTCSSLAGWEAECEPSLNDDYEASVERSSSDEGRQMECQEDGADGNTLGATVRQLGQDVDGGGRNKADVPNVRQKGANIRQFPVLYGVYGWHHNFTVSKHNFLTPAEVIREVFSPFMRCSITTHPGLMHLNSSHGIIGWGGVGGVGWGGVGDDIEDGGVQPLSQICKRWLEGG